MLVCYKWLASVQLYRFIQKQLKQYFYANVIARQYFSLTGCF